MNIIIKTNIINGIHIKITLTFSSLKRRQQYGFH